MGITGRDDYALMAGLKSTGPMTPNWASDLWDFGVIYFRFFKYTQHTAGFREHHSFTGYRGMTKHKPRPSGDMYMSASCLKKIKIKT
jgi:hypothetical protein